MKITNIRYNNILNKDNQLMLDQKASLDFFFFYNSD